MTRKKKPRQFTGGDPKTFSSNVRLLLAYYGKSYEEVAVDIKVPKHWLRDAVSKGIACVTTRNEQRLYDLAKWFGIHWVANLWNPNLVEIHFKLGYDPHVDIVKKFRDLLDKPYKFGFLQDLIKHLHSVQIYD